MMMMMCQKNFDDYNDFPMIVYVEISQYCCKNTFTSSEIQTLYKRFQQLDKRQKGYISEDELLNIPELAINPLAPRIVQLFVNVNFKEFCRLLSFLSNKSMDEEKVRFMFKVCVVVVINRLRLNIETASFGPPRLKTRKLFPFMFPLTTFVSFPLIK